MIIDVVDLVNYLSNVMILVAEIADLIEEILDLFLLNFKFTELNIQIIDLPNHIRIDFREQICQFVFGYERDIKLIYPYHFKNPKNLFKIFLSLLYASMQLPRIILLPNDIINPLSLLS